MSSLLHCLLSLLFISGGLLFGFSFQLPHSSLRLFCCPPAKTKKQNKKLNCRDRPGKVFEKWCNRPCYFRWLPVPHFGVVFAARGPGAAASNFPAPGTSSFPVPPGSPRTWGSGSRAAPRRARVPAQPSGRGSTSWEPAAPSRAAQEAPPGSAPAERGAPSAEHRLDPLPPPPALPALRRCPAQPSPAPPAASRLWEPEAELG